MLNGAKMNHKRHPARDPRTVARDIPGISEILFPQLTQGMVVHLNRAIQRFSYIRPVPKEMVEASNLSKAMLFEVAVARGHQILDGRPNPDWEECLKVAVGKQSRHFDFTPPSALLEPDIEVAEWVGRNLAHMIGQMQKGGADAELRHAPQVTGYQWISSSEADFSIGSRLVEVKCTNRRFGAADYRQVLMYWLLSYGASIERGYEEWSHCILLNPRLNHFIEMSFDDLIELTTGGRSKIELLELFSVAVGDYGVKGSLDFEIYNST